MPLNLYPLLRPALFSIDPETAHNLAIEALKHQTIPKAKIPDDPILATEVLGLKFSSPVGLGAGFDKQAHAIQGVLNLGFGFIELGTVTPLPQTGNPKPRMFRVPSAQGLINRFGFNSDGHETVAARIAEFRKKNKGKKLAPIGINIGNNKTTTDIPADYVQGVKTFAPYADYLTVNISSPNTPGLRDMQRRAPMLDLLQKVIDARASCQKKPPLFVKIAPDQTGDQLQDIADVVLQSGIDGVIIGNTTLSRPPEIPQDLAKEAGGLSGRPLTEMSTKILGEFYRLTGGKIPLIGCGGIFSGADAYEKIRAGASLVQVYTAMVYKGPYIAVDVANELATLLKRDGYKSLKDAVGTIFKR